MLVDWLQDYEKRFESNFMIANLGKVKFHGKVVLNFCNGVVNTTHLEWCVKPYTGNPSLSATGGGGKSL